MKNAKLIIKHIYENINDCYMDGYTIITPKLQVWISNGLLFYNVYPQENIFNIFDKIYFAFFVRQIKRDILIISKGLK